MNCLCVCVCLRLQYVPKLSSFVHIFVQEKRKKRKDIDGGAKEGASPYRFTAMSTLLQSFPPPRTFFFFSNPGKVEKIQTPPPKKKLRTRNILKLCNY